MKRVIYSAAFLLLSGGTFAQADTTKPHEPDTIRVGNFVIIKKDKSKVPADTMPQKKYSIDITIGEDDGESSSGSKTWHRSNVSTNWLIFDLGFANWRDKTVYGSPEANAYLHAAPGHDFTSGDLDLRNAKSSNVNIWLFMQKLNIVKHVVNLKYGLGIEMYNYRYSTDISYKKSPDAYIFRDTVTFSKNKLAVDYVTVPFMLNIDPFPNRRRGLSFSVGVSAGYRYASRNKQISDERGKQKIKGDFDLDPWRIAYIAEAGLGPVRLYGSYSTNTLHENGLKQYPYAVGLRFSNW
jgi:hypothetical protein